MADIRYSVYDNRTDLPIIINGTIPQCAKAMGVKIFSFKSQASRQRNKTYKRPDKIKFRIIRDEQEGEELAWNSMTSPMCMN